MVARFVVEHDHVNRASRLVDRVLLEVAEFCYAPEGLLVDVAELCERDPSSFTAFARQPLRVVEGGRR